MTQSPGLTLVNPISVAMVSDRAHCLASTVIGLTIRNNPMALSANRLALLLYVNANRIKLRYAKDKASIMLKSFGAWIQPSRTLTREKNEAPARIVAAGASIEAG
jgi:hypothetical protein